MCNRSDSGSGTNSRNGAPTLTRSPTLYACRADRFTCTPSHTRMRHPALRAPLPLEPPTLTPGSAGDSCAYPCSTSQATKSTSTRVLRTGRDFMATHGARVQTSTLHARGHAQGMQFDVRVRKKCACPGAIATFRNSCPVRALVDIESDAHYADVLHQEQ